MKFSFNWLKEYIDLKKISPEELAKVLTLKSFEVKKISKISRDYILDVDILPNRAHDSLSYIGLAKEVAALFNLKFKESKFKFRETNQKINKYLNIEIKEPVLCRRYSARFLFNIKIKQSPNWLIKRLEASGLRSINNVVDIMNYVMLETGQPLHAFDYDKLFSTKKIKKLIIRKAGENEEITTLDNILFKLNSDILVISDERQALAIAGIKGGKVPEIDKNTTRIVIESANFDSANIHQTSKFLKLKTDSSIRFGAGLDPNLTVKALDRAVSLLIDLADAKVAKGIIDFYFQKIVSKRISLNTAKIKRFLGIDIKEELIEQIFNNLGFEFRKIFLRNEIIKLAKKLIGRPYKYGASTSLDAPKIFDCSSFTRYLFRSVGIEIPRPSIEQYLFSQKINIDELRPGDLVFFVGKNPHALLGIKERIGHVALYIGKDEIIHADGDYKKVVKENLFKVSKRKQFVGAGRILSDDGLFFLVTVPTIRLDIENDNDLLEEIIRIYGYFNLKSIYPKIMLKPKLINEFLKFLEFIRNILVNNGFSEVYNYSFFGESEKELFDIESKNLIELENPSNLQMKFLRSSLLPNLLKNTKENLKNFNVVKIFEIGNIFKKINLSTGKSVLEKTVLSGTLSYKIKKMLNKKSFIEGEEYFELKGVIDLLLQRLGFSDYYFDNIDATDDVSGLSIWHPLRSAEIKINNQEIGFVGEVNPKIASQLDIKTRIAIFDLDLEKLFELIKKEKDYQPLPKYPAIIRDLSILVPRDVLVDEVLNIIENVSPLIYDVDLFDIYEGEELPENKKSLSFKIIYQSNEKTLSNEETNKIHQKLIKILEENSEWEVRK